MLLPTVGVGLELLVAKRLSRPDRCLFMRLATTTPARYFNATPGTVFAKLNREAMQIHYLSDQVQAESASSGRPARISAVKARKDRRPGLVRSAGARVRDGDDGVNGCAVQINVDLSAGRGKFDRVINEFDQNFD